MYREILSDPIELTECMIELKCQGCGRKTYKPEKCPMTGKLHGEGFEYTCEVCHATLVDTAPKVKGKLIWKSTGKAMPRM